MPYVYSTLTSDQLYAVYPAAKDIDFRRIPRPLRTILINGGANVITKQFQTPKGVVTTVTEEQLADLESVPAFQRHKERGYLTIEKSKPDPEKVPKNMQPKDKSAPMVEDDFAQDKKPKVNTGVE